jgi:hypothetical protein
MNHCTESVCRLLHRAQSRLDLFLLSSPLLLSLVARDFTIYYRTCMNVYLFKKGFKLHKWLTFECSLFPLLPVQSHENTHKHTHTRKNHDNEKVCNEEE